MFAKLKQKIAEEDHSDLGSSLPSSPTSSRKCRPVSKENKWHRRRMNSVSSYYGSRESVFTEPGFISRDPSFTSNKTNGVCNNSGALYGIVSFNVLFNAKFCINLKLFIKWPFKSPTFKYLMNLSFIELQL
jgi:hypothetical protein